MRQKMAIFKERMSVCRDAKISSSILMSFSMKDRGTMRQKMSIFKGGNSVCRGSKNLRLNFDELKHLTI